MGVKIDYEKCCWKDGECTKCECKGGGDKCTGCVEVCPVKALERKDIVEIHNDKCINCGACIAACPEDAISFDE